MSYDLRITVPEHDERCPHCNGVVRSVQEYQFAYWNPTYNYARMFAAALENESGINAWEGRTVAEVEPQLALMIERLRSDRAKFVQYDAPNGWGKYDDLVPFLETDVLPRFRQAPPFAIVTV